MPIQLVAHASQLSMTFNAHTYSRHQETFPKIVYRSTTFTDVHRCIVSPFPAEHLSTIQSLPFTSATPQLARGKKSLWGTLGLSATALFVYC